MCSSTNWPHTVHFFHHRRRLCHRCYKNPFMGFSVFWVSSPGSAVSNFTSSWSYREQHKDVKCRGHCWVRRQERAEGSQSPLTPLVPEAGGGRRQGRPPPSGLDKAAKRRRSASDALPILFGLPWFPSNVNTAVRPACSYNNNMLQKFFPSSSLCPGVLDLSTSQ